MISRYAFGFLSVIFLFTGSAVAVELPKEAPVDVKSAPTVPAPVFSSPPSVPQAAVDYKKFRDPFKEPSIAEVLEKRSDLERYAVTDFRVVAIITGPLRMRAMLIAPDQKTHYVSEKMKIGLRDGVIVKITTKTVVVREKVVNPLGEVELFDTEISIDPPAVTSTQ